MAQRIVLVDDVDGTTDAEETVSFAVDGVEYEMDLSAENAAALRGFLADWIKKARKVGTRSRAGAPRVPARTVRAAAAASSDAGAIREWANQNGFEVSPRGRISGDVRAAYEAAHA